MEPLRVTLKLGARPVKARPRVYNFVRTSCLAACMASLAVSALDFLNLQAVWISAAMATPKKEGFRIVSEFPAAHQKVEKVPGVVLNQEAGMAKLIEARFYGRLDLLQGYWRCPLAPDAQEVFTIAYACPATNFESYLLLPSDAYTRVGGAELHNLGGRCDLLGVGRD